MSAEPNRLERRARQRFQLHLPLAVHYGTRILPGFTQDISGRGLFFYTEAAIPPGAIIQLTFMMPAEITMGESMPVRCRARVLRSSSALSGPHTGIAVQLDAYDFLPASQPIADLVRASAAGTGAGSSTFLTR